MKTIRITGTGTASAKPNQIELILTLSTLEDKYEKVLSKHDAKLKALTEVATKLGFAKEELKTSSFTIRPEYSRTRNFKGDYQDKFTGYLILQSLTLTFDLDMKKLDRLLEEIAFSKTEPKLNIAFTIKEKEEFTNEILKNACIDARKKANVLAEACEQKIIGINQVDFSFSSLRIYSDTHYDNEVMHKCASIGEAITPSDITRSSSVTFVFEIE